MKVTWSLIVEVSTVITGISILASAIGMAWEVLMQVSLWAVSLVISSVLFVIFLVILLIIKFQEYKKMRGFMDNPYPAFQEWLINNRHTGFPHMAETSLEGRMVAMLEWWESRSKSSNDNTGDN